jgi:hypothetical protein
LALLSRRPIRTIVSPGTGIAFPAPPILDHC